jgi:cytochrome P450
MTQPPLAEGVGLPWDVVVEDAVAEIARARATHGDTFLVETGRDRYLFTFSPTGVESFYALPEEVASKGLADYLMLRRKLPDEIFDGRRTMPHLLFRKGDVVHYLASLEEALRVTREDLGDAGQLDVFGLMRTLGHRFGLASWAGPCCAEGDLFDRLAVAFDVLDGSDAFVHPDAMAAVAASDKAAERAALAEVTDIIGATVDRPGQSGLFTRIVAAWADETDDERRRRGIAHDVALVHIASMSNLAAALGWAVVDLMEHPEALSRVREGDREFTERCALETTRLAQRSIMARHVLTPVSFDTGDGTYELPAGSHVATLLPLLNTSAAPGLDRWDPDRWRRHRLADVADLASPQLVTAFGHGRHTCPAQPFSLAAMSMAVTDLFGRYHFTAQWTGRPRPVPAQIGGVARASSPCLTWYRRRDDT